MDGELLAAGPDVPHDRRLADVDHLLDDVELAEASVARRLVGERRQVLDAAVHDVLHVAQPVVDQPELLVAQGGEHAAAAVVAADDDVAHAQHVDGELDARQAVEVGVDDQVGDVAVDEHLARQEADDLVRRHPAVRAADPEVARRLLRRQPREELRVLARHLVRPGAVVGEEVAEKSHGGRVGVPRSCGPPNRR